MTITPPRFQSQLTQPMSNNGFIALQSAQLAVTATTGHITFTNLPGTQRVSFKITNTGTKVAYLCGSNSAAIAAAVASSATPAPASGTNAVSNCDAIGPNSPPVYLDYIQGTDTISAICGGSDTTTLEISIGQH